MSAVVRGVLLAGGSATRLWPMTASVSKHLLSVYDKPMVFYPLSTLMLAGIREIVIVSSPRDITAFRALLGSGADLGLEIDYVEQMSPLGIADGLLHTRPLVEGDSVALILGDNIFYGSGLGNDLRRISPEINAHIFAYPVADPTSYGVVTLDSDGIPTAIEEKPALPNSSLAVTGLYMYPPDVFERAAELQPSARGELEISDLNNHYLSTNCLEVTVLPRGSAWLDAGTVEDLHAASEFVRAIQSRQGLEVACLEEIALANAWITHVQLEKRIAHFEGSSAYARYVSRLLQESRG